MDILYFIRVLLRKKWIITSCTLLAIVAAFFFTLKEKKKYSSTAEIATGFTMNDQVRLNDQGFDLYSINLKFDNVVKTLTSPQVINLLSCKLMLHDLTEPAQAFHKPDNKLKTGAVQSVSTGEAKEIFASKLQNMEMLTSYNPKERQLIELIKEYDYDNESLQKIISVYRLGQTDYIEITCVSENPLLSAFIVNNLCSEFNRFYNGYLTQRSTANVQMLDTVLDRKKALLDSQQKRLNDVMSGGNANLTDANVDLVKEYQTKLLSKKSDLTTDTLSLNEVNNQLSQLDKTQKIIFKNNSDMLAMSQQISDLQTQYENGGSKDQALLNKITSLKTQYQDLLTKSSQININDLPQKSDLNQKKSDLEVKIQSEKLDIRSLTSSIQALSGNIRSSSGRAVIIAALQKDVEQARNDYLSTQEKFSLASSNSANGTGFKQILIGQPAVTPLPSKRIMIVALSGAAAFFITIVIIIFIEYIDLSVKTPSFFEKQTGLKVINTVNRINLKKDNIFKWLSKASSKSEKRQNTIRELIRKIRYSIEQSGHRIILFTSTEAQQGKTTLIQALAYSFSLSKKKILMIDTNFCNNDLTVQVNAKPTLEKFSSNKPNLDQADIDNLITHTAVEGVDAIGCEGGDYTPQEILPEGNVLSYLRDLAERYDYIFLEAAPMNEYSDTKEMMEYVDGIIAIFSSQAIIKQIDLEGINYLKSLDGKFNGAILNKVQFDNLER